jgi:hypothetical protein
VACKRATGRSQAPAYRPGSDRRSGWCPGAKSVYSAIDGNLGRRHMNNAAVLLNTSQISYPGTHSGGHRILTLGRWRRKAENEVHGTSGRRPNIIQYFTTRRESIRPLRLSGCTSTRFQALPSTSKRIDQHTRPPKCLEVQSWIPPFVTPILDWFPRPLTHSSSLAKLLDSHHESRMPPHQRLSCITLSYHPRTLQTPHPDQWPPIQCQSS